MARVFRIISDVTTHTPSLSLFGSSLAFFPHSPSLPLQGMTSLPKAHILICCHRELLCKKSPIVQMHTVAEFWGIKIFSLRTILWVNEVGIRGNSKNNFAVFATINGNGFLRVFSFLTIAENEI
jgi:hypothetical protein